MNSDPPGCELTVPAQKWMIKRLRLNHGTSGEWQGWTVLALAQSTRSGLTALLTENSGFASRKQDCLNPTRTLPFSASQRSSCDGPLARFEQTRIRERTHGDQSTNGGLSVQMMFELGLINFLDCLTKVFLTAESERVPSSACSIIIDDADKTIRARQKLLDQLPVSRSTVRSCAARSLAA